MAVLLLLTSTGTAAYGLARDSGTALWVALVFCVLGVAVLVADRLGGRPQYVSLDDMRVAAAAGDVHAMRGTAMAARLRGDTDEAERLLREAVNAGDMEAMWEMGRLLEDRDGPPAGEPWFRMAAENGHIVARRYLG